MTSRIDLNSDMGEGYGVYTYGADADVLPLVSAANVACGFHAGDPGVMRRTVALAKQHGVRVGAHPGFPDPLGFGRRHMVCKPEDVYDYVVYQVGALAGVARAQGVALSHVKPHGALYMAALEDQAVSDAIVRAVIDVTPGLPIYTLAGSETEAAARRFGLPVVLEYFADRPIRPSGVKMFGWTFTEIGSPAEMAARVVELVRTGKVTGLGGEVVPVRAQSVCVHSDTPGAPEILRSIRGALAAAGVEVAPPELG